MCKSANLIFRRLNVHITSTFYDIVIKIKHPVYQATSSFNSLLITSRNIFLNYCGELWGIV